MHASLDPSVPPRVNMVPDTLLVAKDLFPDAYGDVTFGYSEMWAYLLRTRALFDWDASHASILRARHRIRRYHPF